MNTENELIIIAIPQMTMLKKITKAPLPFRIKSKFTTKELKNKRNMLVDFKFPFNMNTIMT